MSTPQPPKPASSGSPLPGWDVDLEFESGQEAYRERVAGSEPESNPGAGFTYRGQRPETPPRTPPSAIASLVLAIVAPASLMITVPFAGFAMLLTFPYSGPSSLPWLAPLIFWSMPLIFGVISVTLAVTTLRRTGRNTEGSGLAIAALWINASVFVVGLIFTLRFLAMMH